MNSSEDAVREMVSRYSLQPLLRFDLKPVVFIPINTWIWGGQHVLLARCLCFRLPEFTGGRRHINMVIYQPHS